MNPAQLGQFWPERYSEFVMPPRRASQKSTAQHRSGNKRLLRDNTESVEITKPNKKSRNSIGGRQDSRSGYANVFPNRELLTKASEPMMYSRALLLKQNQKTELLELDRTLSIPISKSAFDRSELKDRLEKVLRWKLLRGQHRASLPGLVAQNSVEDVSRAVTKALGQLQGCRSVDDAILSDAISTMCQLRGIGPATAAAFLSFEAPSLVAVFSDEAASFFENSLGSIKYTHPFYRRYVDLLNRKVQELNRADDIWDLTRLEKSLWSFKILKDNLSDHDWNQLMSSPDDNSPSTRGLVYPDRPPSSTWPCLARYPSSSIRGYE